uniref:C3H1-type domain-containing protein n=1 Tax=Opuntia streptacantha TaxID=393608 RepID=A0A7C8ZAS3_OPUST
MQGSQKSKRVLWPSDANLCQVRLFLSEESPSQVGLGVQDHLQAKTTLSGVHLNGLVSDDNLPPGFEAFNPANQLKNKLAQIPLVKWRHPPRFILDVAWQVVSGEESKEVEIQNQRDLRVLEAIYPRESAIPPNPAVSLDVEGAVHDDDKVPLIPITPIEEEDPSADLSSDSTVSISSSTSNPSLLAHGAFPSFQGTSPNFDSGKLAAGIVGTDQQEILKAALTNVARSNEQIDHELLLKILSNPSILEPLVRHQGTGSVSQCIAAKPMDYPQTASKPQPSGAPLYKMDPSPHPAPQFNRVVTGASSSAMISNGPLYPYPNSTVSMSHQQSVPVPPLPGAAQVPTLQSGSAPPVKDLSYYKNLIQQHGGERQGEPLPSFTAHSIHHPSISQDAIDNSKPRDTKPKIMKPCMYFHTPKGCRHGANCVYQHDGSFQPRSSSIPEMQTAKRMKMDREIRGSQSYT